MNVRYYDNPLKALENYINKFHCQRSDWSTSSNNDNDLRIPDWTPKIDIKETKDSYIFKAELPGIDKKNVKISLDQGILTLRGEKNFSKDDEGEKTHRVECNYGSFVRSFNLPEQVQEDKVTAKYNNGILNLIVPKLPPSKQKHIEIDIE